MTIAQLPQGFETLAPFVADWALRSAPERDQRRARSTEAERNAFYQAGFAALPAALAHLDQKPLAQFDESETRLMQLMLSLAHVALAVEAQGTQESRHADMRKHLHITRALSDL